MSTRRARRLRSARRLLAGGAASLLALAVLPALVSGAPREEAPTERRAALTAVDTEVDRPAGDAPTCVAREIPFDTGDGKRVLVIDVHETIDLGLAPFVGRIIDEAAAADDVALVVLNMDTPGGRVDAAQQIKDALLRSKVKTATFINTHALSAGALIAYATDYIIMANGATMGAATPITVSQDGKAQAVGEKMVSALRAIFRATAEAKGRDGSIAESMVDADVEVPGLIGSSKLLTLTDTEAKTWCVADYRADSLDEVLSTLRLTGAKVERRELNWAERVARTLTDPTISGLLMSLGFLGLMLELYSPGFGITGTIGVVCLMLFFTGHMVVNLAGLEELALFIGGLVLLGLEIFVIPGFGIAGLLGITALLASVVLAMVGADVSFSWEVGGLADAMQRTMWSLAGTVVAMLIAVRYLPRSSLFGRLVLNSSLEATSFESPGIEDDPVPDIGTIGTALTPIRGGGKARFGRTTLDVLSQGLPIDQGASVVVVESRRGRIVVDTAAAP